MTTCPKCNYTRQPGDQAPDYECPRCGVVYAKYVKKPEPQSEESGAAAPSAVSSQPAASESIPITKRHFPLWVSVLVLIGLPVLIGVIFIDPPSDQARAEARERKRYEENARYAYFHCQDLVKGRLKAPASASFPIYPALPTNLGDGGLVVIRSYVDAQNGFGAMLRTNFRCKLQYTGGDAASGSAWKFVELTMPYTDFKRPSADTPRLSPGAF